MKMIFIKGAGGRPLMESPILNFHFFGLPPLVSTFHQLPSGDIDLQRSATSFRRHIYKSNPVYREGQKKLFLGKSPRLVTPLLYLGLKRIYTKKVGILSPKGF